MYRELTWDELTWVVRKTLSMKIATKGGKFLEFSNLRILPVDEKVIKKHKSSSKSIGLNREMLSMRVVQ